MDDNQQIQPSGEQNCPPTKPPAVPDKFITPENLFTALGLILGWTFLSSIRDYFDRIGVTFVGTIIVFVGLLVVQLAAIKACKRYLPSHVKAATIMVCMLIAVEVLIPACLLMSEWRKGRGPNFLIDLRIEPTRPSSIELTNAVFVVRKNENREVRGLVAFPVDPDQRKITLTVGVKSKAPAEALHFTMSMPEGWKLLPGSRWHRTSRTTDEWVLSNDLGSITNKFQSWTVVSPFEIYTNEGVYVDIPLVKIPDEELSGFGHGIVSFSVRSKNCPLETIAFEALFVRLDGNPNAAKLWPDSNYVIRAFSISHKDKRDVYKLISEP